MVKSKKIAFFQILYNPDYNAIENIKKSIRSGFEPIVYINKVNDSMLRELRKLKVIILGENINLGIGSAFKTLEQYLIDNSDIGHFIYFDQDTVVDDSTWLYIFEGYWGEFQYNDIGMLFYTSDDIKDDKSIVISSGSLFSVDIIKRYGMHDDNFFVEGSDYEYCLKLKYYKLRINIIKVEGIDHYSLQDGEVKLFFGKKINIRVYGNARLKDFNRSHCKLLKFAILNYQLVEFLFLLKSMALFNFNEIKSRLLS